jgi:hypothetical protein
VEHLGPLHHENASTTKQHTTSVAASGAEGKTMSFSFVIEQQFRAKKLLLSDRINNELLFINLATVRAERNYISPPAASRKTPAAIFSQRDCVL